MKDANKRYFRFGSIYLRRYSAIIIKAGRQQVKVYTVPCIMSVSGITYDGFVLNDSDTIQYLFFIDSIYVYWQSPFGTT